MKFFDDDGWGHDDFLSSLVVWWFIGTFIGALVAGVVLLILAVNQ